MRMLTVTLPGEGHFNPLIPLLRAATRAGHEVRVATAASYAPDVGAAGLSAVGAGPDFRFDRWPEIWPELAQIASQDQFAWWLRTVSREITPRLVADLIELIDDWRPDLVLTEYAAVPPCAIVKELRGLPAAAAAWAVEPGYDSVDGVSSGIDLARASFGLPPLGPGGILEAMDTVLSFLPPSWGALDGPPLVTTFRVRVPAVHSAAQPPDLASRGRPLIYATLGMVYASVRLLRAMISAIAQGGWHGIVTVSRRLDPERIGAADRVTVEQYVPQGDVLPQCDAVVCHGGLGTILGALENGLPLVIIPLGSDQLLNADRAARLGVARIVPAQSATPAAIENALTSVLTDPAFRRRALTLRSELEQMASVDQAIDVLAQRVSR